MKKPFAQLLFLLAILFSCHGANKIAQSIATKESSDNYKLVWSDEFNNDGLPDTSNWQYERGFVRNEEDQWYQPENAFCKNGSLIIEARKEQKPNPGYIKGSSDWRKNR